MNRLPLLLISLCLSCFFLSPQPAAGAAKTTTVLETNELQKIFLELATKHSPFPQHDIEVSNFTAIPATITLPPGTRDFHVISENRDKALGQQVLVADCLVDGVVQGRIKFSGDLALYGDVISSTKALARHSIVTADDLKRVRRNLTMLGPELITDEADAIGKEIKMTLPPGALLYGSNLKEPEMVKRNDVVSILAATGALTITVPGRALSAGARGELIKVKNLMSRKEIFAKIIEPDTVQAQF